MSWRCFLIALILLAGGGRQGFAQERQIEASRQRFDHWQHRKLFPSCTSCHAGAAERERGLWPSAAACSACHEGKVEKPVDWQPPRDLPATNLRFTHEVTPPPCVERLLPIRR
jgi:cytochrome c553